MIHDGDQVRGVNASGRQRYPSVLPGPRARCDPRAWRCCGTDRPAAEREAHTPPDPGAQDVIEREVGDD